MPASERALTFTGQMAQAIADGRKTMTRRALAPSKVFVDRRVVRKTSDAWGGLDWSTASPSTDGSALYVQRLDQPGTEATITSRVIPGSRVMVKEPVTILPGYRVLYHGDPRPPEAPPHSRSPRFMPSDAARFIITIEAARFQRVQAISRGDAMAEGCPFPNMASADPREWFRDLWDSINGPGAWASNPFVLVISFSVTRLEAPHAA